MKKLTRFAALALSFTMLTSSFAYAAADTGETADTAEATETVQQQEEAPESPFEDVDTETQTGKNIVKLYKAGILAGYNEDGKLIFKPDGNITRAELSRIFNGVFKYTPSTEQLANVKDFADNTDPEAWYYNDVRIAQVAGYINGFEDNTFRAKENFTRQQACVVIDLITGVNQYDSDLVITDEVSEWADKYVNWAVTAGLFPLEENNTFRATQNITRAEVCDLLEIFVDENAADSTEKETTDSDTATEATTQQVTVKTANGTVVKVTRGGSGGGGGSSSSSSSNSSSGKTEATTAKAEPSSEAASETTTKASSSNGSSSIKPSNNPSGETKATEKAEADKKDTTTTTKEETTETTSAAPVAQKVEDPSPEVLKCINSVYRSLVNSVIPNCTSAEQKGVAKKIANALTIYSADHTYDIQSAADAAIADYHALSPDEKKQLRNLIIQYADVNDLLLLQQTFFPGLL